MTSGAETSVSDLPAIAEASRPGHPLRARCTKNPSIAAPIARLKMTVTSTPEPRLRPYPYSDCEVTLKPRRGPYAQRRADRGLHSLPSQKSERADAARAASI